MVIAAGAICVYGGAALHAPFVYDDIPALLNNPTLVNVGRALRPPAGALTVSGRPLLNLSFAVNRWISGSDPWSYHVLNVFLHALAGWLVYLIAKAAAARLWEGDKGAFRRVPAGASSDVGAASALRARGVESHRRNRAAGGRPLREDEMRVDAGPLRSRGWILERDPQGYAFALAVGLLWTVHPLQTESVVYTVQRAECLMGVCYLFTLYAFLRGWFVASVLACLVGAGVKESIATAPLLVFAYDAVFVSGGWGAAWRARRAYYLALAATWVPLGWLVFQNGSRGGSAGFDVGVGAVHYWLTQGVAVLHYLKLCFWPHPLALVAAPLAPSVPAFAIVLAAAIIAFLGLFRRKAWGFLGAAFFILLAPTSVIPGTMQEIAEHRMYLPLACVIAGVVFAAGRRWSWALALAALPLIAVSRARNRDYRSSLALWAATVRDSPGSAQAESSYAAALAAAGRPAEASAHFQRALDLAPPDQRHCDLGLAWEQAGRPDTALDEFRQALAAHPRLGFAEFGMGRALFALGRLPEAEAALRGSVADLPRVGAEAAAATLLLGACVGREGRAADAAAILRQAVRLDPDSAPAHYDLGQALRAGGHPAEAAAEAAKALAIDPSVGKARG